jgi:hypothetical protein
MKDTHNIVWGVFLIVIGVLLLLERVGGLNIPTGSLWPLILFALAVNSAVKGRVLATIMFTLLGVIFLGVTFNWFGLSYAHSWPLLMVAAGVAMVVRALTGAPRIARHDEAPHE